MHRSSSLFLREEQDESHGDEDDEVGEDVEPEEGVGLLGVGALPGLVPEEEDQRVDGLGVQPTAADSWILQQVVRAHYETSRLEVFRFHFLLNPDADQG